MLRPSVYLPHQERRLSRLLGIRVYGARALALFLLFFVRSLTDHLSPRSLSLSLFACDRPFIRSAIGGGGSEYKKGRTLHLLLRRRRSRVGKEVAAGDEES